MPIITRQEVTRFLKDTREGKTAQVYLVCGERFLIRKTADELVRSLLPAVNQDGGQLQNIDGDNEDVGKTLNLLRTYSLFPGRQVIRVNDSGIFLSKEVAKNLWDKAVKMMANQKASQAARYLTQVLSLAGLSPAEFQGNELADLPAARWLEMFGFAKPSGDLAWASDLLANEKTTGAAAGKQDSDMAALFIKTFEAGVPPTNILLLVAETVDKRKRLYKFIKDNGVIIDLTVDSGGNAAARKDQEAVLTEIIQKKLASFGKKLEPRALPVLLERIGFHPVAAAMETEKLALSVEDSPTITISDINAIISRTREEALYEVTEAVANKQLARAMLIVRRLRENGMHGLAILATLRNYLRKLLIIRSFQEMAPPAYSPSMNFQTFQNTYLPALKETRTDWPEIWKGHPYATYNLFLTAAKQRLTPLKENLQMILTAEYQLKGSPVAEHIVIDNLLFNLMPPEDEVWRV